MSIVWLLLGIALGFAISWLLAKNKISRAQEAGHREAEKERANAQSLQSLNTKLEADLESLKAELSEERNTHALAQRELARGQAEYANLKEKLSEQKSELENINKRFASEFEVLANKILEEKSKKFADQNKSNLGELLNPLREKLGEFQKKVEDTNKESIERNTALVSQIKHLSELNKDITEKADNLTKALKGDSKAQGNWGEVILERILEKSGLEKDREYITQVSEVNDEGKRYQPDVVIKLPDNKNIIVDSKVSLVAYEQSVNAENDLEAATNLKSHIQSIRTHVKGLSDKNYQDLYGIGGLDFVLLFIPIEPAFTLATQNDAELFNDALSKNIVIVSPSTLIATLRTISSIWKQEHQNKNALEIAKQGGALYDKFVGLTEDLKKLGLQLNTVQGTYQESMKKLTTGTGNLVKRAEKIRLLGVNNKKQIDAKYVERSEE